MLIIGLNWKWLYFVYLFILFIYLFIYLFIHLFELKPHGKAETFISKSPRNYPGKFKEQVTFFQK